MLVAEVSGLRYFFLLRSLRLVIVLRTPSNQIASAVRSYNHRMYTLSIKSDSNTQKGMAFIEPCLFLCVIVLSTPSALTTFVV